MNEFDFENDTQEGGHLARTILYLGLIACIMIGCIGFGPSLKIEKSDQLKEWLTAAALAFGLFSVLVGLITIPTLHKRFDSIACLPLLACLLATCICTIGMIFM